MASVIRKLSDDLINKIAAGDVIHRPCSALKELIENSVDAGSNQINILIREGGLKTLQIQDDGCGMHKDDLSLVCERFTTSKLREFEELQAITTFGFRGEVLASISHVGYLTIISRPKEQQCAYRGIYVDGKLTCLPTPCAATEGTTITVENLFYNLSIRRKALRSPAEEHSKMVDLVRKYSIHNPHIGFSVKRGDSNGVDLRTTSNSTHLANIGLLYGNAVKCDCVEFRISDEQLKFVSSGFVAAGNSLKAITLILFINNRLVECRQFRRGIELLSRSLPKNCNLFLYVSIELDPATVDVNVHPTKEEVRFLYENEILEQILHEIEGKIVQCCSSHSFAVATSSACLPTAADNSAMPSSSKAAFVSSNPPGTVLKTFAVVRSDSREQKLETVLQKSQIMPDYSQMPANSKPLFNQSPALSEPAALTDSMDSAHCINDLNCMRPDIKLTSVHMLQESICQLASKDLRNIIANHVFVGCVDAKYCLIQFSSDLLLIDMERLSKELFYQTVLMKFGNLDVLRLSEPFVLAELLAFALSKTEDTHTEQFQRRVLAMVEKLMANADMLWDYFSIQLEQNAISAVPSLLEGYIPQLEALPRFLLQLATEVNFDEEMECFRTVALALSDFFALKREFCVEEKLSVVSDESITWRRAVEHLLCPEFKRRLLAPGDCKNFIVKLADSHQLYKVFERC